MKRDICKKTRVHNRYKAMTSNLYGTIIKQIKKIHSFSSFEKENQRFYLLNKNIVYCFLVTLVFISFALKYPLEGLEGGIDSFTHHGLTNLIVNTGRIPWSKSVFSLVGMYPVSANSGVHTLMASFTLMTSVNIFYLITPLSYISSVIAILGMFMAAREFKKDDRFAILVSFIYAGTTRYVLYTHHQIGTRGLFLTLAPFFLWALFRFLGDLDLRKFGFIILFAVICLTIHRMGLFILIMVFTLGFGVTFHRYTVPTLWSNKKHSSLLKIFIILSVIAIFVFTFFYVNISAIQHVSQRTPDIFLLGEDMFSYFFAIVYNYAKYMGIFTIFIPIGFICLLFKEKKNIKENVLLITIVLITFMIGGFLYLAPALFGFFSLLIAYPIILFRDRIKKKKLTEIAVVTMVIIGIFFPNFILYREIDGRYSYWMDDESIETGLYLSGSGYSGIGNYVYTRRIDTLTDSTYGYLLERGYGSIDRFDYSTVQLKSVNNIIVEPHNPFTIQDWYWGDTGRVWRIENLIYKNSIDETMINDWLHANNVRHFVTSTYFDKRAATFSEDQIDERNILGYSILHNRYKLYGNSGLSVYLI